MKLLLNLFAFLYMAGPLVIIPFLAYLEGNYYLLFGIPFSYFASYTVVSGKLKGFIYLFTLLCIGFWIASGFSIYQYITFFFFCSLGGYLLAAIADSYYSEIECEAEDLELEELEK